MALIWPPSHHHQWMTGIAQSYVVYVCKNWSRISGRRIIVYAYPNFSRLSWISTRLFSDISYSRLVVSVNNAICITLFLQYKNSTIITVAIKIEIAMRFILQLHLALPHRFTILGSMTTIAPEFLESIMPLLQDEQEKDAFIEACTLPLKKSITINTHKASLDEFLAITKPRWWHLSPEPFTDAPNSFSIDRDDLTHALGNTFLYKSWFFYIQEIAASMPANLIETKPWDIILDVCAAPWGKTSQLANKLLATQENPWLVIANDIAASRVQTLAHNLNLQWMYNTAITKFNGFMFGKHLPNFFDHVLVDAPCSWEWTWFKSDYALKFWRQEEINKIAWTQFQLLISAIKATKVWWTIIYSTCTINAFENEWVLARILEFFQGSVVLETVTLQNTEDGYNGQVWDVSFDQWALVKRFWPHKQKTWGFFVSKLRKVADKNDKPAQQDHKLLPKNHFKIRMHKKLQQEVATYAKKHFGIVIDTSRYFFIATKESVYVTSPAFATVQPHLHCEKVGIPVLKIDKRLWFRPTHYFGLIFWADATKNTLQRDEATIQEYVLWASIPAPSDSDPWTYPYKIIQRVIGEKRYPISLTKFVDWARKNKWWK